MKREDRQKAIMDLLVNQGEVEVDKLSEQFVVSKMTIHRDLDDLESKGMIQSSQRRGRMKALFDAAVRWCGFSLEQRLVALLPILAA